MKKASPYKRINKRVQRNSQLQTESTVRTSYSLKTSGKKIKAKNTLSHNLKGRTENPLNSNLLKSIVFSTPEGFTNLDSRYYQHLLHCQRPLEKLDEWFSDDLKNRRILVDWVGSICQKFDYSSQTMSLCLNLFDRLRIQINENDSNFKLSMLLCLSLASKISEHSTKKFPIFSIMDFFDSEYTFDDLLARESEIYQELNFNANRKTVYDFITFYLSQGFLTLTELQKINAPLDTKIKLQEIEMQVLSLSYEMLKYPMFNVFDCSIVACSILALIRHHFNLEVWNERLTTMTTHSFGYIFECMKSMADLNTFDVQAVLSNSRNNRFCQDYLKDLTLIKDRIQQNTKCALGESFNLAMANTAIISEDLSFNPESLNNNQEFSIMENSGHFDTQDS